MKWTVVWRPPTEDNLADLWVDASDRNAISQAADTIDQILRSDPYAFGESRSGNTRILIIEPLAVVYDVLPDDCLVMVTSVRLYKS
jgi:hypothetical protein